MPIGDRDKEGNTLILGGWEADLYQTPTLEYLLKRKGDPTPTLCFTQEEALSLYNQLNNTHLKEFPKLPTPKEEEEGIELPLTKGKILGKFESYSQPGTFHYVIKPEEGYLYCTCSGFSRYKYCWHYLLIKHIGVKNITGTITISIKKEASNDN